MMKVLICSLFLLSVTIFASCDMRSETAKKEMEKFSGTPTPPIAKPTPEIPVDPADVVQVDTTLDGDTISLNLPADAKLADCKKYNRVRVNGDGNTFNIKGVCREIMINGDRNQITADTAMEFAFNGSGNTVHYSRFPNGKRPTVTDNQSDNTVEKVSADTVTKTGGKNKTTK